MVRRTAATALALATLLACGSDSSPREEVADEDDPATTRTEAIGDPASPSSADDPASPSSSSTSATEDAPPPPEACERAQACCPAHVAALPPSARGEANEACATLALAMQLDGRARDEACHGALEGFRSALRASALEVPEPCR